MLTDCASRSQTEDGRLGLLERAGVLASPHPSWEAQVPQTSTRVGQRCHLPEINTQVTKRTISDFYEGPREPS